MVDACDGPPCSCPADLDRVCYGGADRACEPIDWRARALAAEAKLDRRGEFTAQLTEQEPGSLAAMVEAVQAQQVAAIRTDAARAERERIVAQLEEMNEHTLAEYIEKGAHD